MSNHALPCCLGHHVLAELKDRETALLRHPDSGARVIYREDRDDHVWSREELDRHGAALSSQELYRLVELFEALKIDDAEGYQAVIDGELIEL